MLANRTSFVYPNLDIHFDRIAKNANTFIYIKLNQLENSYNQPLHRDRARIDSLSPIDMPIRDLSKFKRFRHLVIARNPFDRALSMFLNKIAPGDTHQRFSIFPGYGDDSSDGFKAFLRGVENESLRKSNYHMWTQIESLLFRSIHCYTDIIYFENLQSEFSQFLQSLGLQADVVNQTPASLDPKKTTQTRSKRMHYFDQEAIDLVAAIYQQDFEAFGYSLDSFA
jgi:hypothetical protein